LTKARHCAYISRNCAAFEPRFPIFRSRTGRVAGLVERTKQGACAMARRCELTGKGVMSGNNVSHANNKSRRKFLPNLCDVTLISDTLGRSFRLKVSAQALRTVEHRGGLDGFLAKAKADELSDRARRLKRDIAKSSGENAGAEAAVANVKAELEEIAGDA